MQPFVHSMGRNDIFTHKLPGEGGIVGQVTTGGHEGHVTVGVVGQLQTGGGWHVGHGGHVSLGVVGTEEGEEVENHS